MSSSFDIGAEVATRVDGDEVDEAGKRLVVGNGHVQARNHLSQLAPRHSWPT